MLIKSLAAAGSSILGALLVGAGSAVALAQAAARLQARPRPLNERETVELRRVFGDALALSHIRLVDGRAGVFGISRRAFTLGNTIYLKRSNGMALLVHEATHVWQYQRQGPRYAVDCLCAQWFLDGYVWEKELGRGRARWLDFNKEAQAQFIQDLYVGSLGAGPLLGSFFDVGAARQAGVFHKGGKDFTALANDAVAALRAGSRGAM